LAVVILQLTILKFQEIYGPRFLLPSFLLPKKFNYFKQEQAKIEIGNKEENQIEKKPPTSPSPEDPLEENLDDACPICLASLSSETEIQFAERTLNRSYKKVLLNPQNRIMTAPCSHRFHTPCLANWMEIRLECPSCRSTIPYL